MLSSMNSSLKELNIPGLVAKKNPKGGIDYVTVVDKDNNKCSEYDFKSSEYEKEINSPGLIIKIPGIYRGKSVRWDYFEWNYKNLGNLEKTCKEVVMDYVSRLFELNANVKISYGKSSSEYVSFVKVVVIDGKCTKVIKHGGFYTEKHKNNGSIVDVPNSSDVSANGSTSTNKVD